MNVLRDHGHAVIASDVFDYGGLHFVDDFLAAAKMPAGTEAIVTNPPFMIVEPFVAKALELSPIVVIASASGVPRIGAAGRPILEDRGLARVHVFRKRLPMMHRDGWEGRKANSGMAFAWMVWDRDHTGPTTISRISWGRCTSLSPLTHLHIERTKL